MAGAPLLEMALGERDRAGLVALVGPTGCGRTVICLQSVALATASGDSAVLLTSDPPGVLLQQAASLDLDLSQRVSSGALALLQLQPDAAALLRTHGARPLVEQIWREQPEAKLLIIDPLTALLGGHWDEEQLRGAVQTLFSDLGESPCRIVVTARSERLDAQPLLLEVLLDLSGALLWLDRDESGQRSLKVRKSRFGAAAEGPIAFAIGPGGAYPMAELESPPPSAEPPQRGRRRVLIVDRDPTQREQLVRWLEDGYVVSQASSGFEALSSLLSDEPDLIVLDPSVEDVPGLELLAALQKTPVQVPILALSHQMARAADRICALVLGASDFLAKPARRFELEHKVETLSQLPRERRDPIEPQELDLADLMASRTRILDAPRFRERMRRAWEFGQRYALPSSLGCMIAHSPEGLKALLNTAEDTLRSEDSICQLNETMALFLLVAAPTEQATRTLDRVQALYRSAQGQAPAQRSAIEVSAAVLQDSWWNDLVGRVEAHKPARAKSDKDRTA